MPRASFGVGMLQGANPGLTRLAQSVAMGDNVYDRGYDQGITQQSKIAQALANIRNANASADAHSAVADQTDAETGILRGRNSATDESVALDTGATLPMIAAVRDFTRTGIRPMKAPVGPATEDGTEAAPFPVVDDGTQSKIAKALARSLVLRTNLKDTKPDDLSKAAGDYRNQDLGDQIIAGTLDRNRVGGAQAAVAGKDLYKAENNGTVLDQFTGSLNEGGGLAQANIGLTGAKTKAEGALATERYASAGQHSASAAKTRQEIEQGVKTGQLKLEKDADGNIVVVDLAKGTSRVTTDANTGLPVKVPAGGGKPLTETQGKATTFAARMQDAERTIQELEAAGVKGSALTTRAAGSEWTNWLASSEGQQYRQAQENWVTANLRQESGAAIGVEEMAKDVRKFFPAIGDGKEVIAQKARAREVAARGMLAQAGAGAAKVAEIVGAPPGPKHPGLNPKPAAAPQQAAPVQPASEAEYNALPSGSIYIAPDGKTRRKL